jgi:hypothetical protein
MNTTTTAQNIIDATSQDIRSLLDSNGTDAKILLDYTNRTSLDLLRASRWEFLSSAPQRFVTQAGITDYWIGATGQAPAGSYDTGLNLTDVGSIRKDSVWDRTNNRLLQKAFYSPTASSLEFPDGSSRAGRPERYRNQLDSPFVLSLYPAPDNQNGYTPVPTSPLVSAISGGALAARTYYVKQTFVDSAGHESQASTPEAVIFVPANFLLRVQPPVAGIKQSASGVLYNQYRVYVSTSSNTETLQSVSTSTSASWTEPTTGLVAGVSAPSNSTLEPVRGYVMEFTYFKQRTQITDTTNVLQVPDDYFDIMVAGVNAMAYTYLIDNMDMMQFWSQAFMKGKIDMIRDKNLFPGGSEFIRPDSAAVSNQGLLATDLLYIYGIPS